MGKSFSILLFLGGSTNDKLTSWKDQLEKKQQDLKAGQRSPLPHALWVIMMCGMARLCVFPQTIAGALCLLSADMEPPTCCISAHVFVP